LYGSIYLLPLYLAQIQNYNALQIGEVIMWMGVPQLFLIPLVPVDEVRLAKMAVRTGFRPVRLREFFIGRAEPGLRRTAVQSDLRSRALGQPLIMVTISLIATAYILPQDAGSASSLFNILRTSAAPSASPCSPPCWMREPRPISIICASPSCRVTRRWPSAWHL
jgi:DHA2 family multidrug resistance protein